jgi:hypothetical protein
MNQAATPVHVRLLGAPGTGKTRLAAELTAALSAEKHAASMFTVYDNPALPHTDPTVCTTLLMGLDLPAPPASEGLQQATDRALRNTLAQAGVNYQVVYGHGEQRLRSALAALRGASSASVERDSRPRWVWACDNCSDPQCERRLLSDLLAARQTAT